jgi:hypothetical protein
MVKYMKQIVPEFISKNSVYEKYDKKWVFMFWCSDVLTFWCSDVLMFWRSDVPFGLRSS